MPSKPATRRNAAIRIGCAGWSIATQQAHAFGEGDSLLARYATRFDVVEINSTFHRAHQPRTFERWAASVPRDFRFSVKVPRTITHDARLVRTSDLLAEFAEQVAGLGNKLGGVLVQLPPSLAFDARTAGNFFKPLRRWFEHASVACEPRHASWFAPAVAKVWERFDIARVAADPPKPEGAEQPGGAGTWCYWRLHGAPRMYYSAYDDTRLAAFADELREHGTPKRPAWCMFDNTAHSHAIENALRLVELTRQPPAHHDAATRPLQR